MIDLIPLGDTYTILQLDHSQEIPSQIYSSEFYSITRTSDEISIITNYEKEIGIIRSDKGWKGFKVDGILDFSLTGIVNDITRPLKDNGIAVFIISTFNTDYIFVKEDNFLKSQDIFRSTENIRIIPIHNE